MAATNADDPISKVNDKVKDLNTVMIGVILVMFLGFITLLFTLLSLVFAYQKDSGQSYDGYTRELKSQNDKIDDLTHEIRNYEQKAVQTTN